MLLSGGEGSAGLYQRLEDTLETIEQLLESIDEDEGASRFSGETIHTRPVIGTAMRIINFYEWLFCFFALILVSIIIFYA